MSLSTWTWPQLEQSVSLARFMSTHLGWSIRFRVSKESRSECKQVRILLKSRWTASVWLRNPGTCSLVTRPILQTRTIRWAVISRHLAKRPGMQSWCRLSFMETVWELATVSFPLATLSKGCQLRTPMNRTDYNRKQLLSIKSTLNSSNMKESRKNCITSMRLRQLLSIWTNRTTLIQSERNTPSSLSKPKQAALISSQNSLTPDN